LLKVKSDPKVVPPLRFAFRFVERACSDPAPAQGAIGTIATAPLLGGEGEVIVFQTLDLLD
jgi:hypothetical protein